MASVEVLGSGPTGLFLLPVAHPDAWYPAVRREQPGSTAAARALHLSTLLWEARCTWFTRCARLLHLELAYQARVNTHMDRWRVARRHLHNVVPLALEGRSLTTASQGEIKTSRRAGTQGYAQPHITPLSTSTTPSCKPIQEASRLLCRGHSRYPLPPPKDCSISWLRDQPLGRGKGSPTTSGLLQAHLHLPFQD